MEFERFYGRCILKIFGVSALLILALANGTDAMGVVEPQGLGWPELKVTAKAIEHSQIMPGKTAMLNLTVSEVRGDDWAKDVKAYVDILNPKGTNFSETGTNRSEHYLGNIERLGSVNTSFALNVSDNALFGNRTIKITIEWYETGWLDWGIFGPYYEYSYINFTVLNSQEETVDEGVTTIPYMTYLVLHDPNGDGSYSYIEKDQQFTIGSEFDLGSSKRIGIEANLGFFGVGPSYSKYVNLSNTTSGGVEINFKTTDRFETSSTGTAGAIGPGYGDVFYGERWDIHHKFINRSTWLGYDGQYSTTVGGKNNLIIGHGTGVVRDLPSSAIPNTLVMVTLNVVVGQSKYYSIDEQVPSGWKIVSASNDGDYISTPGHVKWIVENNATDAILTYNISIPSNITGIYTFSGEYRLEGSNVTSIVGDYKVTIDEIIPIEATREISKNQAVPGSSFTVKISINTNRDNSEINNLYLSEVLPIGWNITSYSIIPLSQSCYVSQCIMRWGWSNVTPGDIKTIIYNVTIPINASEKIQSISGDIQAGIRYSHYKFIDYDRVYQYYIIRSSEFIKPGYWIDQNVEEPWRSQILGMDIGFNNFIDDSESKKVEFERNLNYTATDSPLSHSRSTTVSNSSKISFTMDVNETVAIDWGLNIKGISFGGKVSVESSFYIGYTNYTKNAQKVESGYTIMDKDTLPFGDSIDTAIYYDKVFGTYLFITDTNTSYTINPREPWTKSPLNISPTKGERGEDFKFLAKMRRDLNKAEARIQQPDEIDIVIMQLFDDGVHGDEVSGDGIYGNSWNSAGAYGEYYVDVWSWDLQNQRSEADNVATFSVFIDPPSSISNLSSTVGRSWINWSWTDPLNADFSKVMIYIDGIFQINVTKGVQYYNATSLAPATMYEISTRTVDLAGNINSTWVNYTAITESQMFSNISFDTPKVNLTMNSIRALYLTLDSAPNGLSGYNITISLSNGSVAEIISVDFPAWATLQSNSSLPGDSVWLKAADLNNQIINGTANVLLATLTIRGDSLGKTNVNISVTTMDDDGGAQINPNTVASQVEVSGFVPFPCDLCKTPTDSGGDGLYEDINGNGRKDFSDVVLFFSYLEWVPIYEPIPSFDFNGNGRIDFNDIIRLFEEL